MKEEILVPAVGESITSGILSSWIKKEGEQAEEGEDLFELETDKATVAVPAPADGVLHIQVEEGREVEIGQVVGYLEEVASGADRPAPEAGGGSGGQGKEAAPTAAPAPATRPAAAPPRSAAAPAAPSSPRQTRVPMSRLRQTIARRLVQARQETALLTTFNEIDMDRVIALRRSYGERFEQAHGVRLGFMSFFVKACCQALKAFPGVNALIDGEEIVYNNFYDIGIAVSTERGLVVPVLRDADRLGFPDIERQIHDLARRARDRKIAPDELAGGTFTITNGGVFGSLLSTPLPNYPQCAILGLHAIQKRPVAAGDRVVVRPMMYVALSYDHRLVDGRESVQFLVAVKKLIEDPQQLILEV